MHKSSKVTGLKNDFPTLFYSNKNKEIIKVKEGFGQQIISSSKIIGKPIKEIIQPIFADNINYQAEENLYEEYAFLKIKDTHPQIAKLVVGNTESPDIMFVSIQEILGHFPKKKDYPQKSNNEDLVFLVDSKGEFKQANHSAYKKLGYSKSKLLSMNVADITHPSIQEYIYDKWDYLVRSSEARGEHLLKTQNGTTIYAEYRMAVNVRLGLHLLILKVINNVTPKRNIQNEVERTVKAIDDVLDGVIFTDTDFKLRYVNNTCIDILGYNEKEMLGKSIEDFCKSDQQIKKIKKNLSEEGQWHGNITAIRKDQTEIELELKITALPKGYDNNMLWQGVLRDITSQIETEQNLSRNKHRFERLLQAAPDGILIVDEHGTIQHSNNQITKILGYKEQEVVGEPVEILLPESLRKNHQKHVENYQQNPQKRPMGTDLELYAKHKNGSKIPVDIMLGPLEEDEKRNTIAIIRDISKFKNIQARLEREKEFTKLLHRLTTIANQNTSLNQTLVDSIREICEYMNWPVGHVYLPANDGTNEFYPSDIWYIKDKNKFKSFKKMTMCTRFKPGMGMVGEVIESGDAQWYSNAHKNSGFVRRMPDTDLNIRACFGLPILIKDKVVGVLEFFTDQVFASDAVLLKKMTTIGHQLGRAVERTRSESLIKKNMKLFKQLFEHSPAGVVVLDKNERVINVNNSFSNLFGYSSEELIGKKLDNLLVPKEFKQNAMEFNRQTFRGDSLSKETVRKHKDGTEVPVVIHTVPVVIDDEIEAIFGIYVNLSKVKETENQLRESLEEKKFLLEEIHHRVKNNLAIITSLLELQIHQAESKMAIRQLKDSQSRIYSMAMVHEHLYQMESFSYLELDVYLKELVKQIKSTFEDVNKQIDLTFETESVKVSLDQAISCGQLINEVVTNAFKHAFRDTKSGNIFISLACQNGNIELQISDDGSGIPQKVLSSNQSSLGLKLVNTLTKQLEGKLEVNGENGTTFKIHFPKGKIPYKSQ